MIHRQPCKAYIAACAPVPEGGGVYTYTVENGRLIYAGMAGIDRPMYLQYRDEQLYTLLRAPFTGSEESALAVLTTPIAEADVPGALQVARSTKGRCGCHLTVAGDGTAYAVNYLSGSVIRVNDGAVDIHAGHGENPTRQEAPHTHCVILSPDEQYVLVTDLGLDTVFVYDRNLRLRGNARVPDGHGARHLIFAHDGKTLYCVNELKATVTVFAYADGTLTARQTVSATVDYTAHPENLAAAVRLSADGWHLYVSNRGEDTIAVFAIAVDGAITFDRKVPCGGKSPRDFNITPDGAYLVSTNMDSDTVTLLQMMPDGTPGTVLDTVTCPKPLCVVFD